MPKGWRGEFVGRQVEDVDVFDVGVSFSDGGKDLVFIGIRKSGIVKFF